MAQQHSTLYEFLTQIGGIVEESFPIPVWIHCEIADIKHKGNYAFMELQECDANGKKIAAVQAAVWQQNMQMVFTKFQKMTGQPLQKGLRVLLRLEPKMDAQWGFKVVIKDIDPAWTLGDAEKNNEAIRQKLKAEGIWDKNRNVAPPLDFLKVAVICPENSAGEGDFFMEANKLSHAGICEFMTFTSAFEGQNTIHQIERAFQGVYEKMREGHHFDALCIIRGGGASTGFTWLNQYPIIKQVALCPIPVLSGIGHERDITLIDEVAFSTYGTPSKVIGAIAQYIVSEGLDAANNWDSIGQLVNNALMVANNNIEKSLIEINSLSQNLLGRASDKIVSLWKEGMNLGPQNTLNRGYSLVKNKDNKIVHTVNEVKAGDEITILLKDGEIKSLVK